MGYCWDRQCEDKCKEISEKICEGILNERVWNRIVAIEKCLFKAEDPNKDGTANAKMEAVVKDIIIKMFGENEIGGELESLKTQLEKVEKKQQEFQITEANLKDTKEELEVTQKELEQTKEKLRNIEKEKGNLQQRIQELQSELEKKEREKGEALYQVRQEKEDEISRLEKQHKETIEEKDKNHKIELEDKLNKQKEQYIEEREKYVNKITAEHTSALENLTTSLEKKEAEWNNEKEDWKRKEIAWEKEKEDSMGEKRRLKEENNKLEERIKNLERKNSSLENRINGLEYEKKDLNLKLEKSVSDFKAKQMQYEESVQENHKILQEKENLAIDLENLRQNLEGEQKKVAEYHNKFGIWDEDTKEYQGLLDAMFRCDSLSDMLQWYEIKKENGVEDVSNILKFIGMFCGAEPTAFLKNLYNFLEDDREENKKYLSPEEIHLFDCLNHYYRQQEKLEIEYDLIRYPEAGDKFDKNMMADMEYRTKIYRTVEGVYVPTIMRDERNPLLRALIKGV